MDKIKKRTWFKDHPQASSYNKLDKLYPEYKLRQVSPGDLLIGLEPAQELVQAFKEAKMYSTEEVEKKFRKYKELTPQAAGWLIELMHRKEISPDILQNYKTEDLKKYYSAITRISKNISKDEQTIFMTNLAALGTILGAGGLLTAIVDKGNSWENITGLHKYLEKNKGLTVKLERAENTLQSFFNPSKNLVHTGPDLAVAAHEFGHAQNARRRGKFFGAKLGKTIGTLMYASPSDYVMGRGGPLAKVPFLGMAAIPLAHRGVTKKLKGTDTSSPRYKIFEKIEENPVAVGALAVSPKLLEEGKASVKALINIGKYTKSIREVAKAFPKLMLAFGTYGASAALPVASMWAMNRKSKDTERALKAGERWIKRSY
jgi:hypothetical protein